MAWRHKTLRSSNILINGSVLDVSDDGTISPAPEGDLEAVVRFLPEFEFVAEEKPVKKASPPSSSSSSPKKEKEQEKPKASPAPSKSKTKKKKG